MPHMDNFGVFATPERQMVFDINDFDETLPAPWEYDVKRLVASLVPDARDAGWGDAFGRELVAAAASRYQTTVDRLSKATTLEIHYAQMSETRFFAEFTGPKIVKSSRGVLASARRRTSAQAYSKWVTNVAGHARFVDDPPLLERLPDDEVDQFHELFNLYRATLPPNRRHVLEQFRFRDVAHKVVGVGSVGLRSYVLLFEGRREGDPLVLQAKEATSSVLSPYVGSNGPARPAGRARTAASPVT